MHSAKNRPEESHRTHTDYKPAQVSGQETRKYVEVDDDEDEMIQRAIEESRKTELRKNESPTNPSLIGRAYQPPSGSGREDYSGDWPSSRYNEPRTNSNSFQKPFGTTGTSHQEYDYGFSSSRYNQPSRPQAAPVPVPLQHADDADFFGDEDPELQQAILASTLSKH